MEKHVAKALQNYSCGYTCSQAILCAFAEDMKIDEETAYRMSEGFGGGCGGMQEMCGAVNSAFTVISYFSSNGKARQETFAKIRKAASLYEEKFGSIICREVLKGNKPQALKCGEKVRIASEIIDRVLENADE